jgi:hypothetical protein
MTDAEQSANGAIADDPTKSFPRAHYVLGHILAAKGDSSGAVEQMSEYLVLLPAALDAVKVRHEIAEAQSHIQPH